MSYKVSIKERLDTKLRASELLVVKQALIVYLAAHDPKVENTQFSNSLMDILLPFLKDLSQAWESIEPADLNTSYAAINTMYHSLRGLFRSLNAMK